MVSTLLNLRCDRQLYNNVIQLYCDHLHHLGRKKGSVLRIDGLSWDEDGEEHIRQHGVKFEEVEEAARNISYARRSRGYLQAIGQTDGGRYLLLILDDEGDGIWYPVTARPATESEMRLARRAGHRRRR